MTNGRLRVVAALMAAALVAFVVAPASAASTPSPVPTRITTGFRHTCALTGGGGVKCWGANADGELGNGS